MLLYVHEGEGSHNCTSTFRVSTTTVITYAKTSIIKYLN